MTNNEIAQVSQSQGGRLIRNSSSGPKTLFSAGVNVRLSGPRMLSSNHSFMGYYSIAVDVLAQHGLAGRVAQHAAEH